MATPTSSTCRLWLKNGNVKLVKLYLASFLASAYLYPIMAVSDSVWRCEGADVGHYVRRLYGEGS